MYLTVYLLIVLSQTQLSNGTHIQHSIEEKSSVVLTSYSGIFRIEVSYEYLNDRDCRPTSSIRYEFVTETNTCIGKLSITRSIGLLWRG